jgi:molecular chaperone DnaK
MAIIGIDLGTTYSAVAISGDGRSARVIPNAEGKNITPSVVFFEEDQRYVGEMAKNLAAASPSDVVQFIKREMGNSTFRYITPAGEELRAEEISALILKRLKQDAENALNEKITGAVITVPAYFDDARRTATKVAGKIAGLNVLQVLNEPTAAAIAYGALGQGNQTIMVYDLGGGTFDVTLMKVQGDQFDVIATDGDANLGGFDFDNAIAEFLIRELTQQGAIINDDDFLVYADVREKAELIKRALSEVESKKAIFTIAGKNYTVTVTRPRFEELTKAQLEQTEFVVTNVLESVGYSWGQIDQLLMVGGSTRMPMVRAMLERLSGKTLKYEIHPDEAAALGAAILSANLPSQPNPEPNNSDHDSEYPLNTSSSPNFTEPNHDANLKISDVTSQSLGIVAKDPLTNQRHNSIIIMRNTKIPCSVSKNYVTEDNNQTRLSIKVTEGNDTDLSYVKILGTTELSIPAYPKGAPIEVKFNYDINQTIFVEVIDQSAHRSLGTLEIDREGSLSKNEILELQEKIESIQVE